MSSLIPLKREFWGAERQPCGGDACPFFLLGWSGHSQLLGALGPFLGLATEMPRSFTKRSIAYGTSCFHTIIIILFIKRLSCETVPLSPGLSIFRHFCQPPKREAGGIAFSHTLFPPNGTQGPLRGEERRYAWHCCLPNSLTGIGASPWAPFSLFVLWVVFFSLPPELILALILCSC